MQKQPTLAAFVIAVCCGSTPWSLAQSSCTKPEIATDTKFVPGQVWHYRTRPTEMNSTVTVLRVETTPKQGTIIHVRIEGIHMSNCKGGGAPKTMEHAPFTRAALEESVTEKAGTVSELPDDEAGYRYWLDHCGGAYTITVERMVAINDAQFNAGLGCH